MLKSLQVEKLRELEISWSQDYDRLVNLSGRDRLNLDLSRGKPSPEQQQLSNYRFGVTEVMLRLFLINQKMQIQRQ